MARTIDVTESRTYTVRPEEAYGIVAPMPLPELFSRGFLALPAIRCVEGQTGPEWGSEAGHIRTIVTTDGGTMRESLVSVDAPRSFGYEIDRITGPMRPLVTRVAGTWRFDPDGAGAKISWSWHLEPRSRVTAPIVALVGLMWRGYARRALERLSVPLG